VRNKYAQAETGKCRPTTNRLLAMLDQGDYDALMRDANVVSLRFRARLVRQDGDVDAVYFPLT